MTPTPFIPPLYLVIQPTNGETVATVYAEFTRRYGLPPAEVYEHTPLTNHKAALHLIRSGPVPVETNPMPKEAQEILEGRILTLLASNPEGITAREIGEQLGTDQIYSNTALKALLDRRDVVCDMKPTTTPGHFRSIFFLPVSV